MEKLPSIKDSNIAMIGSSEDLESRVKAAKTEKEWIGAGKQEGLQIWRIEKFNVKKWPQDKYGEFYGGDCYICLKTYKKGNTFKWDVHFWLGAECTTDEKGTAAYKTVELDDLLGTIPVQHREVMGYESNLFKSYFPDGMTILKGGVDSGFNHVEPEKYQPRLFHIKGKRSVQVMEVELKRESLNTGDAFILDKGLEIFVWLPSKAGRTEKLKANQVADKIKGKRKGFKKVHYLEEAGSDEFWKLLGGKGDLKDAKDAPLDEVYDNLKTNFKKTMFKLSDESGKMKYSPVDFKKESLDTKDVFIIDGGSSVICWIGKGASVDERKKAILYAQRFLTEQKKPIYLPIIRVIEGREGEQFNELFE